MVRLLSVLVLAGVSVQGQTTSYSDIVGYSGNLFFYKNQFTEENRITSIASPNSFQARYGFWDFSADLFEPYYPTFYPLLSSDPESLAVSFANPGNATLSGVVHPYTPELLPDTLLHQSPWRPYAPPASYQGIGIEFLYTENTLSYSSIIVLNSLDGEWISSNDQAVVGQIRSQAGGIAISMVPEPSSLSLLIAGGVVLMAGRRKKQD